jgi:hypothetical protein
MTQNPENPYGQPAPYGQPGYAAPYGAPAEDPGKTLGIIGLVLCFVVSIAGLIVSIIAKKKSEAAGFTNNTPAKVGVILGWIFTILGLIGIIIYIIAIVALVNSGELTNY